jgi:methyltransferase (TIGR00027 family)
LTQDADWDIVTGVGITALGVAAGRAIETHRPGRLVEDPYAEAFVRAAQPPLPMPTRPEEATGPEVVWDSMATYMGVRSKFFDEYFASASALQQVVLLAAGLDARAFRLDWPPHTTVYELDMPRVLDFKDQVLARQQARPRCERRTVACDLRGDWPSALLEAGFDRTRPAAWLAEGLLPFLPDQAKEALFTRVHELSAPGSRIAAEHLTADVAALLREPVFRNMASRFGFDLKKLWPADQHLDPVGWLTDRGWAVTSERAVTIADQYQRSFDDAIAQPMRSSLLITGDAPALSDHRGGPCHAAPG